MEDLKTTLLLIESEQRNEILKKENKMLEDVSDYLKDDNEELIKKYDTALIQLLQKERIIDRLIKEKNELKNK